MTSSVARIPEVVFAAGRTFVLTASVTAVSLLPMTAAAVELCENLERVDSTVTNAPPLWLVDTTATTSTPMGPFVMVSKKEAGGRPPPDNSNFFDLANEIFPGMRSMTDEERADYRSILAEEFQPL